MSVTNFAADNSEIRVPIPAGGGANMTGAMTIAFVGKRNTAAGSAHAFLAGQDSGGNFQWEVAATSASSQVYFFNNANGQGGISASSNTQMTGANWYIVVWTKASGTVQGRLHRYSFAAGTWQHEAAANFDSGAPANLASIASGHISFGEAVDVDDLDGRIAVAGTWTSAMTDPQVEALSTNLKTSDWKNHAVAPVGLWEFNRALNTADLTDLTANAQTATSTITSTTDHSGIAGTTIISGDDPAGWTFDGASGTVVTVKKLSALGVG